MPKDRSKERGPSSSLFLHQSPGASHVSLPGILAPGATVPRQGGLPRQRSEFNGDNTLYPGSATAPDGLRQGQRQLKAESTRSTDRTDALWAEMQATLEEVELSASGGTHVFGSEHDRKLAELRNAQIALAQAWARSEADDTIETTLRDNALSAGGDQLRIRAAKAAEAAKAGHPAAEGTDGGKSTAASTTVPPGSTGVGADRLGARLEEETEVDIILARRRREANDEYFQRVNNGVLDVVAKLEEVALAMRAVEQESKDVWDESKSVVDSIEP